ncbi:hypothetical protein [Marinibacterium sp. SX1]|uniref:hypothetical protein n=1 Tax=Marinibacterium sp. SX1 TaxID=3388424 RepID=UPI003D17D935
MDPFLLPSGRTYQPLPLAADAAFPARVSLSSAGVSYVMLLYPNIDAAGFAAAPDIIALDGARDHLVMRLALDPPGGDRRTLRIRKVALGQEIDCGPVFVAFPGPPIAVGNLQIAKRNLNGTGAHGTRIIGGIAPR